MTLTSSVMFTYARALVNALCCALVNKIHDKYSILNLMHAKIITVVWQRKGITECFSFSSSTGSSQNQPSISSQAQEAGSFQNQSPGYPRDPSRDTQWIMGVCWLLQFSTPLLPSTTQITELHPPLPLTLRVETYQLAPYGWPAG